MGAIQNVNKGKRAAIASWAMRTAKRVFAAIPRGLRISADNFNPKTQLELAIDSAHSGVKCHTTDLVAKGFQICNRGTDMIIPAGKRAAPLNLDATRIAWAKKRFKLSSVPWSLRPGNHPLDPEPKSWDELNIKA